MTLPEQIQEWAADRGLTHQQHTAGTAVFGAGHAHRYALTRTWEPGGTHTVFVLLNPSIATADQDDPTVRRLIGFARREGHGGLLVANLFAARCTNPSDLAALPDPVGTHNDDVLQLLAETARDITLGWGTWGALQRAATAEEALTGHGARLWALGTTKDGHPRHPLYLAKTSPLQRYEPGAVR
ncbi:DUF1643 domain-containing protein [Streptomyces sp. NPDC087263]|uniref:DUF1643 domain-containing protein n=1 Tax=Streptomyces sp. NPDC087263 TaxID=3365773 RepID=UPI003823E73F